MNTINLSDVERTVDTMADVALANEKYFCELDAAAGDADFGVSLASGFKVIKEQWNDFDRSSIGSFLMKISMVITSHVGGCSGPIWGTAFMKAGILSKDKQELTLPELVKIFRSAIEGMMARGGAKPGDKTLLDALVPATDVLEQHVNDGKTDIGAAFQDATQVATEAIEKTRDWTAQRGRQSFTGDRSKGTLAPGIVAVATMMQEVEKSFAKA